MLGILLAILSSISYGTSGIFARLGLQYFRPMKGAIISLYASVALALLVTLCFEFKTLIAISLTAILWFALVGFVHFALGRYFDFLGVGYIGVSRAAVLRASSPLFSMVLAIIFLKETLTMPIFIGTLMIFAGLYVLIKSEQQ
jgi:drug/metabolite transporter (DMT)-like permease